MESETRKFNLLIGGDFCPHSACGGARPRWGERILEDFRRADYRIVNLEGPVTGAASGPFKYAPRLKLPESALTLLNEASVDLVTLANNHTMDYGRQGLIDTLENLKRAGIPGVGAGMNLAEAVSPRIVKTPDFAIAVLNFCETEWSHAQDDAPGTAPLDVIDNARAIARMRRAADFVVVIVHGGVECYEHPTPRMCRQYRFYADMGASAVVAHHTHCPLGYEVYNGVPIFYSLGNLLFPSHTGFAPWYRGFLTKLTFGRNVPVEIGILPYRQCLGEPVVERLSGDEEKAFIEKIGSQCEIIASEQKLKQCWSEFVSGDRRCYELPTAVIPGGLIRRIISKFRLGHLFLTDRFALLEHHSLQCASYNDIYRSVFDAAYRKIVNRHEKNKQRQL